MNRSVRAAIPLVALLVSIPPAARAQPADLPVIRANSTSVDVHDGHNLRKGHWFIDPNTQPDVYYAQRSTKPKKVTFTTDVESISFDVEPGRDYDFVILLNGQTRCHTRISGMRRSGRPANDSALTTAAEIPFTLHDGNLIRVEGRVNDSQPLSFQFDTGADTTVIYPSAAAKGARPHFDGTVLNSGLGGTATRRTSNDNTLRVAGLVWDHEQMMLIEKQGKGVDGILGFNVFEDRVIEIDYDRNVLTVHPAPPPGLDAFDKSELQFRGATPYIQASFEAGAAAVGEWILLDTGYTGSLLLERDFWTASRLGATVKPIGRSKSEGVGAAVVHGDIVRLPSLALGGATLRDVPTHVKVEPTNNGQSAGLIGMDVLKRFNTVLDFQNNVIYLKPNGLVTLPFAEPATTMRHRILAVSAVGLVVLVRAYLFRRKRRHTPSGAR